MLDCIRIGQESENITSCFRASSTAALSLAIRSMLPAPSESLIPSHSSESLIRVTHSESLIPSRSSAVAALDRSYPRAVDAPVTKITRMTQMTRMTRMPAPQSPHESPSSPHRAAKASRTHPSLRLSESPSIRVSVDPSLPLSESSLSEPPSIRVSFNPSLPLSESGTASRAPPRAARPSLSSPSLLVRVGYRME